MRNAKSIIVAYKGSNVNLRSVLLRLGIALNFDRVGIPKSPVGLFVGTFNLIDSVVSIKFKQYRRKAYIRITITQLSKAAKKFTEKDYVFGVFSLEGIKRVVLGDMKLLIPFSKHGQTSIFV